MRNMELETMKVSITRKGCFLGGYKMKKALEIVMTVTILALTLMACSREGNVRLESIEATMQIIQELSAGNVEGAMAPFRGDARDIGQEEKMEEYCRLLNGREYLRCECVKYEVEGSREELPRKETTYYTITLEDETVLYAISYTLTDTEWDGFAAFDLYSNCPWQ